jgi:hypothetical protein
MESVIHNDYRQHPIESGEGLERYREFLAHLEAMIADQEDTVLQARAAGDEYQLANDRTRLWRLLTKRQGVADAILAYERQRATGHGVSATGAPDAAAPAGPRHHQP